MSSQDIIRGVSKKLKYYFEVKRLEDGFDLSGADCPRLDHPPLRSRPTLMYDGLHDRPVKHYFSKEEIRQALTQFKSKKGQSSREKQMKQMLERYMRQYHFKESPLNAAYYRPSRGGRRQVKDTVTGFGVPLRKSKRAHTGGYPVLRSVPTQYTSVGEANRMIKNACKILVTTETIDLEKSKGQPKKDDDKDDKTKDKKRPQSAPQPFESGNRSRLPPVKQRKRPQSSDSETSSGSDSDDSDRRYDDSAYSTRPGTSSPADDRKEIKPWLRREMKKNGNSDREDWVRPTSAMEPHPPSSNRPGSSIGHRGQSRGRSGSLSSLSSSDSSMGNQNQNNRNSQNTQTGGQLLANYEPDEKVLTDGERIKYRVHVYTGDKMGAATKADIKLVLIGNKGRSQELMLQESRNHKVKFQKGQEDIFDVESYNVGLLNKIFIGHDRQEMGTDWYLDRVLVKDMKNNYQYEVSCDAWLSHRSDDKRTAREFPVLAATSFRPEVEESRSQQYHNNPEARIAIVHTKPHVEQAPDPDERTYHSEATRGSGPHTSTQTNYSDRKRPQSPSVSETTDTTYTTTTFSESTITDERRDREMVSPRGPPVRRKDDFFDQAVHDKDYSSVIESLSVTTEQDNREDFDNDRPVYARAKENKPLTVTPVPAGAEKDKFDYGANVQVKAEPDSSDHEEINEELLIKTVRSGSLHDLKKYLEAKPELKSLVDKNGWTLLHWAASSGVHDITQWLTVQVVDLEVTTPSGSTPMHLASMAGKVDCMRNLHAMGASTSSRTLDGETPLHLAAQTGESEAIKFLVSHGADVNAVDESGKRAADVVRESDLGHFAKQECLKYLEGSSGDFGKPEKVTSSTRPKSSAKRAKSSKRDRPESGHSTASSRSSSSSYSGSSRGSSGGTYSRTSSTRGRSPTAGSTEKDDPAVIMTAKQQENHDKEIMEKKRLYEEQQAKMESRKMSFLDSVRADAEN